MDENLKQQMREALLARWKRAGKILETDIEANADLNQPQVEIIDIAQSLEQIGRDTSLQEQERRELIAIERALAKMATGSYGVCEDCGDEIMIKRLQIVPEARLCANCQALEERQASRMRAGALGR